jgi:hypothetical protein
MNHFPENLTSFSYEEGKQIYRNIGGKLTDTRCEEEEKVTLII